MADVRPGEERPGLVADSADTAEIRADAGTCPRCDGDGYTETWNDDQSGVVIALCDCGASSSPGVAAQATGRGGALGQTASETRGGES